MLTAVNKKNQNLNAGQPTANVSAKKAIQIKGSYLLTNFGSFCI